MSINALDRPAFNKMNVDIESGKIGAVIVWDITRRCHRHICSGRAGLN